MRLTRAVHLRFWGLTLGGLNWMPPFNAEKQGPQFTSRRLRRCIRRSAEALRAGEVNNGKAVSAAMLKTF